MEAVVVAYGRSAVARASKGSFSNTHPVEYAGQVLKGVLDKLPQLDRREIDDVIYGCSFPVHMQTYDIAKMAALRAGLPAEVPGITVSRFCSSGLDAISLAASRIMSGQADVVVAGGIESMSLTPKREKETENEWLIGNVKDAYLPVGLAGENTAFMYNVTKEEMAEAAAESHRRAAAAQAAGKFDEEIIPVTVVDENGQTMLVMKDEGIRADSMADKIAQLKPAFGDNGLLTAGTSSQRSDGTGCVVLMSLEKAIHLGIKPIARFVGASPASGSPSVLTPGLLNAIEKAHRLTGLRAVDMDVIELNEAFASVLVSAIRELMLDPAKVNPNGGAMALGHPLGATGAILTCKALSELQRVQGRYAMVTMCVAAGQGCAGIFERM